MAPQVAKRRRRNWRCAYTPVVSVVSTVQPAPPRISASTNEPQDNIRENTPAPSTSPINLASMNGNSTSSLYMNNADDIVENVSRLVEPTGIKNTSLEDHSKLATSKNDDECNLGSDLADIDHSDKEVAANSDSIVIDLNDEEEDVALNMTRSNRGRCLPWPQVWALLVAAGTKRLTKSHYNSVRRLIKHVADDVRLPSFNSFTSVIRNGLLFNNCVRASKAAVPVDDSKAGTKPFVEYRDISFVSISEYAKADFQNPIFLSATKQASYEYISQEHEYKKLACFADFQPLVYARSFFFAPQHILTDNEDRLEYAECGDIISLKLFRFHAIPPAVDRAFKIVSNGQTTALRGSITCIHHFDGTRGIVNPTKSSFSNEATQIDITIDEFLSNLQTEKVLAANNPITVAHESSSDSNDDVPAVIKKINSSRSSAARKRKRNQRNTTWKSKEIPTLRPSDTICILKPTGPCSSSTIRLIVIYRFWSLSSEAQRFCAWIPASTSISPSNCWSTAINNTFGRIDLNVHSPSRNKRLSEVSSVLLVQKHLGSRLLEKCTPISSIGKLADGTDYGIYRGILYWDGFQMFNGKAASAEGVYFKCLNTETSSRGSPDTIRVLTLLPPGSKADDALQLLSLDIVHGTCRGFRVIDAEGVHRTIFLDIVGFFGDTPALNSTLDVRGHNATGCCHLCTYVRGDKSLKKARYPLLTHGSQSTSSVRLDWKHQAVRSYSTCPELEQRLGMKSGWDMHGKGIQSIKRGLETNAHLVPMTSRGLKVVPAILDSFQATLVSPDHLLTAVIRDSINVVYNSLPSKDIRSKLERFIHLLLTLFNSQKQRVIFHKTKHVLHTMSMSQLYDIATIFPIAFSFATTNILEVESPRIVAGRELCMLVPR